MKELPISIALASLVLASCIHAAGDGLPRGALDMPYKRYEAESGTLGGKASLQQSPNFAQTDIACEASDRKYVSLAATGDCVGWTVSNIADGITMRFTMPDSADGSGLSGSLGFYVNGVKVQDVALSSYHAYQYFHPHTYTPVETPGGKTFMRFDEVHFKLAAKLKAGDAMKIQKDNGDAIAYGVDFLELEDVPAAIAQPANSLSITNYGAVPDDANDDLLAFTQCIAAALAQRKNVYVPPGRFLLNNKLHLTASKLKIQGAGMWHTELYFSNDSKFSGGIYANADNVEVSDFYMNTTNRSRMANGALRNYKAFMGTYGSSSSIHHVWEEHFECGFWIGDYDPPYIMTDKLLISHCRIRNNYADGATFCQGTANSIVENCSLRNNGDDAMAVWPASDCATRPCTNDVFRNNTVENNWRAGAVGIFGGHGHQVRQCLIKDGVGGSAIRFSNEFPGYGFDNTAAPIRIYENTIIGCGTSRDLWDRKRGAIEIYSDKGIFNVRFDNNDILNSQRDAIQMYGNGITNMIFNNTTIDGTGRDGTPLNEAAGVYPGFAIMVGANSQTATFSNLTVRNCASGTSLALNKRFRLVIAPPPAAEAVSPTNAPSPADKLPR